ncbi:hypothetical protein U8607_04125 [Methylobacterium durans]|uniref:hypothetical protein n=1 Tax=Methylobacterium durans TaxID=2202825 RepID=UPI002AFFBAB9|nr:hypothetical protein [Methylobacterium durans]MEA1831264.1 hypothetical protein [Methylobacterium durans]
MTVTGKEVPSMSLLSLGRFLGNTVNQAGHAVADLTSATVGTVAEAAGTISAAVNADVHLTDFLDLDGDVNLNVHLGDALNGTAAGIGGLVTGATSPAADSITGVASALDNILTEVGENVHDLLTGIEQNGLPLGVDAHLPGILDLNADVGVLPPEGGLLSVDADLHLLNSGYLVTG